MPEYGASILHHALEWKEVERGLCDLPYPAIEAAILVLLWLVV